MKKEPSNWIALLVVLTAPLLSVIDVFIINVAVPAIQKGIHATNGQVQLVIAGYLLGYASFLITGSRTGDHLGRKRTFFWGMLSFTVFSCFCGLSNRAFQLNAMRFLQGVSASFMVPQAIAYIQVLFTEPKDRSKAIGYFGITLGIASITGQVLGGYLADTHFLVDGWRLIFFINLPIGLAALWATHVYLPETPKQDQQKLDYSGVVILTMGLFCLIVPLIMGRESGWPWWSFTLLFLSGLIFGYFIIDQQKKRTRGLEPLIDLALFANKDFDIGLLAAVFHFMMHTSYLLISAVFMQNGLGLSPLVSGLYFVLPGLLFTLSSMVAAKLIIHYGPGVLQVGLVLLMITLLLQIVYFRGNVSSVTVFALQGMYGLGNGLVLPSLLNITLRSVPTRYAGAAAGIYSTCQQTASALGVCIVGGLFYSVLLSSGPNTNYIKAFQYSMGANIICLALVSLLLLFLPTKVARLASTILAE
ncbi:MFS transporter [Spirosoma pollinicola]|uniref:MFS transporter n=1 Tax=Spirosoma pollinicola TaxID=2057025 RepID=A0A2K8Z6U6_9BACT|nr:MFS transporter [Spirosoma pollinicola]AUD05580.1 MFS transporter [Spirosoma pollinicola]